MASLTLDLILDSDIDDIAVAVHRSVARDTGIDIDEVGALEVNVLQLDGPAAGASVINLDGNVETLEAIVAAFDLDVADIDRDA